MFSFKPFRSLFGDRVQQTLGRIGVPGTPDSFAQRTVQSHRKHDALTLTLDLPDDLYDHLSYLENYLVEQLSSEGIKSVRIEPSRLPTGGVVPQPVSPSPDLSAETTTLMPAITADGSITAATTPLQAPLDRLVSSDPTLVNIPAVPPTHDAMTGSRSAPMSHPAPSARPAPPRQRDLQPHPRIKQIVVVASGKGGVGKSTTTANLALALRAAGKRVGVLDADIYGPSIPTMLGVSGRLPDVENEQFVPIEAHGLAVLSIGNLTGDEQTPIVWRGPKATGALMQLYNQTNWPELDYLLIDMPPGTGDIQLTLAQRIPVTGAIIVTTPQHVALLDAQKGIEMFSKVDIPVLGIIENMATHVCSACGHHDPIFGQEGGQQLAEQYAVPILGQIPLDRSIRVQADEGRPSVVAGDSAAPIYQQIATKVMQAAESIPAKRRSDQRLF